MNSLHHTLITIDHLLLTLWHYGWGFAFICIMTILSMLTPELSGYPRLRQPSAPAYTIASAPASSTSVASTLR